MKRLPGRFISEIRNSHQLNRKRSTGDSNITQGGVKMRIMKAINAVPGGLMVVPLFIGMVINTFFPNLLKIGGFTEALSGVGYPTFLGMYLFTVGCKMTLKAAPRMLKRGFGIMFVKVGVAIIVALAIA